MAQFKIFYFNPLRVCCYIIWDNTKECVIIDPGCTSDSEQERLAKFIDNENLKPVKVLLTHGHFDHVLGLKYVVEKYGIPYYVHLSDINQISSSKNICDSLGLAMEMPPMHSEQFYENEDIVFGETRLKVIHTPGHTPGGVCFYLKEQNILFSGDTLFQGSIGRTDFEYGDFEQLIGSIKNKLMVLPDETEVYPGHGLKTTIEEEKNTNPFLT